MVSQYHAIDFSLSIADKLSHRVVEIGIDQVVCWLLAVCLMAFLVCSYTRFARDMVRVVHGQLA